MKILLIPGSLRKHSFNKALAAAACKYLKTLEGIEVSTLDYSNLPMLDLDHCYPFPEAVDQLRETISAADALWFFTPEYNGSFPGGLKNMLDYASLSYIPNDYASGSPLKNKPCAISGAGGKMATAFAQDALITLLKRCGCLVMENDRVRVAVPAESFASGIYDPTDEVIAKLRQEAEAFIQFVRER